MNGLCPNTISDVPLIYSHNKCFQSDADVIEDDAEPSFTLKVTCVPLPSRVQSNPQVSFMETRYEGHHAQAKMDNISNKQSMFSYDEANTLGQTLPAVVETSSTMAIRSSSCLYNVVHACLLRSHPPKAE